MNLRKNSAKSVGGGGTPLNKLTLSIICAIALSTTANAKHIDSDYIHSSGVYNDNETHIFGPYRFHSDDINNKNNRIPGLKFGDDVKVGTFVDGGKTLTIDGKDTVWEDKLGRTLISGVGENSDGTLNITNGAKFITKNLHLGLATFKITEKPVEYTHYGKAEFQNPSSKATVNVIGKNSTLKADNILSIVTWKNDKTPASKFNTNGDYIISIGGKIYLFKGEAYLSQVWEGSYILNLKNGGTLEIGKSANLGKKRSNINNVEFNSDGGIVRFTEGAPNLGHQINLGKEGIAFDTNGNDVELRNLEFQLSNGIKNTKFKKFGKGILKANFTAYRGVYETPRDIEVDGGYFRN